MLPVPIYAVEPIISGNAAAQGCNFLYQFCHCFRLDIACSRNFHFPANLCFIAASDAGQPTPRFPRWP